MQILILDQLVKQTKKRQISKTAIAQLYKEFDNLQALQKREENTLYKYLINQNGKKLKGAEYIWKYRTSSGDRILYTYGKYLPYVRDEDALVLLAYAKHDNQDKIKKLPHHQGYLYVDEFEKNGNNEIERVDLDHFHIDDLDNFFSHMQEGYLANHSIYVIDTETLTEKNMTDENWQFYLSTQQDEVIQSFICERKPMLIMGGAGTGKTVVAIHLLNDLYQNDLNRKRVYFTQSEELLNRVKGQYEFLSGKDCDEHTQFFDINEFCIELLDRKGIRIGRRNFVRSFQDFLSFLYNNEYIRKRIQELKLSEMDVWTEIRGVIKGSLDDNWRRNIPISQYDAAKINLNGKPQRTGDIIKKLVNLGFMRRVKSNTQLLEMGLV